MALKRNRPIEFASVLILTSAFIFSSMIPALAATPPTVSISWPKSDMVIAGNYSISGQASGATSVELRFDDETSWKTTTGTSSWNYTWATKSYVNGYHNISARAKNGTAASTVTTVRVYVNNTVPQDIVMDLSATPLQITSQQNITVSGFIEYDTGVALAGRSVKIEVLTTNISVTASTDQRGYLIKTFQGPKDANKYTVRSSITDGRLSGSKDIQISVSAPVQPDLAVKSISLDPAQPDVGVIVTITANIINKGNQSGTATVKLYLDGKYLTSKPVEVEVSTVVTFDWSATGGEHTIKILVDNVNPADKDPANNQWSIKVTPTGRSAVHINSIVVSNPSPHKDDAVSIMVGLDNTGYIAATGKVSLYDGDPGDGRLIAFATISLGINQTQTIYMSWKAVQGTHNLTAQVVVTSQPNEPQRSIMITVLPPKPAKKAAFIPFPGAVTLLSVLIIAAMITGSKRREGHFR